MAHTWACPAATAVALMRVPRVTAWGVQVVPPTVDASDAMPSCPDPLAPQQYTAPAESTHVSPCPSATPSTAPDAANDVGILAPMSDACTPRSVVSPRPSWPEALYPQHTT